MNILIKIMVSSILLFLLFSCDDNDITQNENKGVEIIKSRALFNYEFLGTAPLHTQTSMLSKYQNKLYRFGSRWPVQVFDVETKIWSQIQLPDSSFWRWDGAAVTVGSIIYVVAVRSGSGFYDILKLDPITSKFEHTNVNLPETFHYPAYCVNSAKIIFLYKGSQKTYELNTVNNQLNEIAENPFYSSNDVNLTLSSGKHGNYFYVFGGYSDLPNNLFYRLDLESFIWGKLDIPNQLEKKYLFGATLAEQFVLFSDSVSTYDYSFIDSKWYEDTLKIPIYPRSSTGEILNGEWSFYQDGTAVYGTNIMDQNVWKITKK